MNKAKVILAKLKRLKVSKWRIAKIIDVHWNTVSHWSKGTFNPTEENFEKLNNILKENSTGKDQKGLKRDLKEDK